jgi:hypothetical protein
MGLNQAGPQWTPLTKNFFNDGKTRFHEAKGERWSDGAALALGRVGNGQVILDQINWRDGMGYAEEKLVRIVSSMLGNLGAAIQGGTPARWSYNGVPLIPNRTLTEWMNWGRNDLSRFPTGSVTFSGVPFTIPQEGKQVIMLRSTEQMGDLAAEVKGIPVNGVADELCFLQTCTYGFDYEVNKTIVTYRLNYADGTTAGIPVVYGVHIFDWQRPGELSPETVMVWDKGTPEHDHAFVYLMRRPNPYPEKRILAMDVIAGQSRAVPVLLALTLGRRHKEAAPVQTTRAARGPWQVAEPREAQKANLAEWAVIGPFDNGRSETDPVGTGYFVAYPPEEKIDLSGVYRGKSDFVRWQCLKLTEGHVDFNLLYPRENIWTVAYAYTRVYSPTEQDAVLHFGSDDGAKVWLNGKPIIGIHVSRGAGIDQHVEKVHLGKGPNDLLIKVEQMTGGWEMYYRFDTLDGRPLEDLKFSVSNKGSL